MGPILIVTGPSGVGKTTVSRLVSETFDTSVHLRIDDFIPFIVNGGIEPWRAESAHQNYVLGGAVVAAAMQFAKGGYTVVIDGHIVPRSLNAIADAWFGRGITLHYAVLRADLATCVSRAAKRSSGDPGKLDQFRRSHERFADLGSREANVIDASGAPHDVTAAVVSSLTAGRLLVKARGSS